MFVYRLCRKKYAGVLSGAGAAKAGGRWNSIGTEIIYTAESRALALAELLVHLKLENMPSGFQIMTIQIPDYSSVRIIESKELPSNWNVYPPMASTQQFGDRFVKEAGQLLLKVPSAVVKGDHNLLINPHHREFKKIKIHSVEDFPLDRRLFKA